MGLGSMNHPLLTLAGMGPGSQLPMQGGNDEAVAAAAAAAAASAVLMNPMGMGGLGGLVGPDGNPAGAGAGAGGLNSTKRHSRPSKRCASADSSVPMGVNKDVLHHRPVSTFDGGTST
jgi:hypothetical protein